MKEECPMTVVQCELHHAGCEVMLPRKDMADHMKEDSIAHISLLLQELTRTKHELPQKITYLSQGLNAQQRVIDQLQRQQQRDLQDLRTGVAMHLEIVPVTIKMAGFERLKKKGTEWFSRPFYSSMGGYKMCLEVHSNGYGDGDGTHVSVATCFMRGEFDSRLKWPFRGDVTIQLVNQLENKDHCTGIVTYSDVPNARVTDKERDSGLGIPQLVLHSELGVAINRQYLKDDCLIFRIVSIIANIDI